RGAPALRRVARGGRRRRRVRRGGGPRVVAERVLTTHVGSLPRPQPVVDQVFAEDRGDPVDYAEYERVVAEAVREVVRLQAEAVAEAMKTEYEGIVEAGFYLQVDSPDLAMGRHIMYRDEPDDVFVDAVDVYVAAINHALRDVPADRVRLHLCWGNYEGPHHCD